MKDMLLKKNFAYESEIIFGLLRHHQRADTKQCSVVIQLHGP
jgi:hypothetical protein